jgi:16S rRNA G966 N2-methylase RsmD
MVIGDPLLAAVGLHHGTRLLDVATRSGALAAEAANRGARPCGRNAGPAQWLAYFQSRAKMLNQSETLVRG